jgi:hypothetical protein
MNNYVGKLKLWSSPLNKLFYSRTTLNKINDNVFIHTGELICVLRSNKLEWQHYSFHGLIEKVLVQYITDSFYLDVEQHLITYARNCVCETKSTEQSLAINYFKADVILILSKSRGYIIRLEKEIGYVLNTKDHIGFIDMDLPRVMKTLSDIGVYSLCF